MGCTRSRNPSTSPSHGKQTAGQIETDEPAISSGRDATEETIIMTPSPADARSGTDHMMPDPRTAITDFGIEDALARIRTHPPVADLEQIPVPGALRRILAEDVVASFPVPAHDSSAMDGYAFRFTDLTSDRTLRIEGRVAAGHPLDRPLVPGTAARIFTGGAMPDAADTVAMQEHCLVADGSVTVPAGLRLGDNRRHAGEDVAEGAIVLRRGTRLRPQDMGLATSVGRETLTVRRRVNVGVIATGDELRSPGQPLPLGCVFDTNRYTVSAALEALGVRVTMYPSVVDTKAAIKAALLRAAADNDLVISTGGVSSGDEDHVKSVVEDIGSLDFWRLPLKPGRPIAVGDVRGTPFVGLPGNPVSAMVTFWLIGRPFVLQVMGASTGDPVRFPVVAAFRHDHRSGRREFLRARLQRDAAGRLSAQTHHSTSSGVLSSLTWSDGLVEIPESFGNVRPGDVVSFIPYHGLD